MIDMSTAKKHIDKKFIGAVALLALVVVVGVYLSKAKVRDESMVLAERALASTFEDVDIQAHSAYVYDVRTHTVLYAKNEEDRLPLASLTKVMSALVASELGNPTSTVVVTRDALDQMGDSGLYADEKWSLKDLLDFSLVSSSNDGMQAVALALGALERPDADSGEITADFVSKMNEMADTLNMKNTYFWNATGLDETEYKGGAYGTAEDMALLFDHVLRYKPELLEATKEPTLTLESLDGKRHTAENTDQIITKIPGVKASKTGYTDVAGGNLVIAFDPEVGRPIIIAVLGSTISGRFEDVEELINASIKYINEN